MRRYVALRSIFSVSVVLLILHIFCPTGQAALKGGCAKVNITPPLGIPLIGSYGKPSDDVIDELYAKAMVFDDGTNTVAIVSADLLYSPLEEITDPVREIIKEKLGIPEQNVLICATHTHSGPEVFTKSKLAPEKVLGGFDIDRSYLETLIKKLASSVMIAQKNVREVRIGAAKGEVPEIVYNRRPRNNDGLVKMAFTLPAEVRSTRKIETDSEGNTRVMFTLADEQNEWHFGPVDPEV
ncbi:MAG: neutral/alkaline non-lysosomal ceramidase N-terminal domain-containing protein, partial [Planctomycetota bacterium]